MSPTLRREPAPAEFGTAVPLHTPRAAVAYAWALLVVALATVAILASTGSPWPAPGPFLVLSIPLALCVNRFVLYPNELGVTAEAAVMFAAVVVFHASAPWLGPLLLALCSGLLNAQHWAERSFVRMIFNAGDTALVTAVALLTFDVVTDAWGTSWAALVGAAALAAVPYAAAELGSGAVLEVTLGRRARDALLLPPVLNAVVLPLGVLGALAGAAALEIGWWAAILALLPVPLVPEFVVLGWTRRDGSAVVTFVTVAAALATAGLLLTDGRLDDLPTLGVLLLLATFVRAENGIGRGVYVAPLAFIAVAAAITTMPSDVRLLTAAVMAVAASRARSSYPWLVLIHAIVAAAVADAVFVVLVRAPVSAPELLLPAMATGVVFLVVAQRSVAAVVWFVPILAAVAGVLALWHQIGDGGGALFVAVTAGVLVVASAWGSSPWPSRLVGPRVSPYVVPHRRALMVGVLFVSAICIGLSALDGDRQLVWLLGALVGVEAVLAMAMSGVRQWRFAPGRRALECAVLVTTAGICIAGIATRADADSILAAVVLLVTGAIIGALIARPFGRKLLDTPAVPDVAHRR